MTEKFQFMMHELDPIIKMAWEDRTTFEAILLQFGLSENEVIKLMRRNLKESSFKRWPKCVNSGVSKKNLKKHNLAISPFKCSRKKAISVAKINKR